MAESSEEIMSGRAIKTRNKARKRQISIESWRDNSSRRSRNRVEAYVRRNGVQVPPKRRSNTVRGKTLYQTILLKPLILLFNNII